MNILTLIDIIGTRLATAFVALALLGVIVGFIERGRDAT